MWRALCHCRITLIFLFTFLYFLSFVFYVACAVTTEWLFFSFSNLSVFYNFAFMWHALCHCRIACFLLIYLCFFYNLSLCGVRCVTAELRKFFFYSLIKKKIIFIIYVYVACAVSLQNSLIYILYRSLCMYVRLMFFFEFFLLPSASPRIIWQSWFPIMIIILGLWTFW